MGKTTMSNTVDLGTVFTGSESGKILEKKGGTRVLRPNDVVIDIAYSGLCGTDMHFRKNPNMVLGHEGVGVVTQVGPEVSIINFGDRAVLNAQYVHKIPDGYPLCEAGPLQCGGATVYGAIVSTGVTNRHRVGVLGLGGLGHLATQYLNRMGCETVVFS